MLRSVVVISVALHFFVDISLAAYLETSAKPFSFPPSQYWDGNDGSWSTFHVQIGTPPQTVRLLPGTSATATNSIWAVLAEGCELANPDLGDCSTQRGGLFTRNESLSWSTDRLQNGGLYELELFEEVKLGLAANAYYGFDTISLGLPGQGLPNVSSQVVAGFADNDFWLGSLGLSPISVNFTNLNEPVPSLLENLKKLNNSPVPSSTWSYTAGASYMQPPKFGSLTFGGYDARRFDANHSVSVPFGTDQSRDLLVGLQSITYDTLGSTPLMSQGGYYFIDSVVSHLWLPSEVCRAFEVAFGLVWDDATELYLLNDTTRSSLRQQKPSFKFTVGSATQGGDTTIITIPYSAFDVEVKQPLMNTTTPYFPLKRAQNSSQYTLGRVFLQEAYVIADYDRKNFTVAQAKFPSSSEQDLVAILPPGPTREQRDTESLSTGAIVGIVVGAVVVIVSVSGLLWWLIRRRRRRAQKMHESQRASAQDGQGLSQKSLEQYQYRELSGGVDTETVEMAAADPDRKFELAGNPQTYEVAGDSRKIEQKSPILYELPGHNVAVAELQAYDARERR